MLNVRPGRAGGTARASELGGIDLVLLDARAADFPMQQMAAAMSDLIVASALTSEQAKDALNAVIPFLNDQHKALSLISVNATGLAIAYESTGSEVQMASEADVAALDIEVGQFILDEIAYHSNALDFGLNSSPAMGFHAARIFCSAIVTNRMPGTQAKDPPPPFIRPRDNVFETVLIGR
ncbi:hypothetical protein AB1A64_15520 [Ruegeria sp. ANG10]|uniref:hypothetical protein n=1 Tax=Ruegeria sp. ANG10 TaxID=3042467 RepID=UPI003451D9CC